MEKDNNLTFDAAPSARRIDDNGYLHVSACPISKACINPYYGREIPGAAELGLNPTGIYYGYRDPDELAKAAETFNGLPLLLEHHFDSACSLAGYCLRRFGTGACDYGETSRYR